MSAPFRVVPLDAAHERSAFRCASDALNRYLHEQVEQDMRRRIVACFVAVDGEQRIAGYYTLASSSALLTDLPEAVRKKLPRYPTVPVVRMGGWWWMPRTKRHPRFIGITVSLPCLPRR